MKTENFEKEINLDGLETKRTYIFSCGFEYTINNPKKLYVKESGSHTIIDSNGLNHHIKKDFKVITFEGKYAFNIK